MSFCRPLLAAPVLVALLLVAPLAASAADGAPAPQRIRELVHLVREDCGACHGLTLQGGLGPPLTATALADRPVDSLVATILHGRPGTPMPPFSDFLAPPEAQWVAEHLIRGFPAEVARP